MKKRKVFWVLLSLLLIYSNVISQTLSYEKIINSIEDTLYIVTDISADNNFNDSIEKYWQNQIPDRRFKKVVMLADEKDVVQLRKRIKSSTLLFYGLIEKKIYYGVSFQIGLKNGWKNLIIAYLRI